VIRLPYTAAPSVTPEGGPLPEGLALHIKAKGVITLFNTDDGRHYRAFDLKPSGDRLEGYAVVFDQKTMLYKDPCTGAEFYEIIERTAFDGCDMADVVLNVDHEGAPIARTRAGNLQLIPDNYGLKITASLTTSRGKAIWEEVQAGNLDKMSFAFNIGQESYDKATHTRTIQKISRLFDVSVVTRPAYEQTCVFARATMEGHAAEEQRAYVEGKVKAMRSIELQPAPELREEAGFAGMEYDIEKHEDLLNRARELMAWKPEGRQEDISDAEKRYSEALSIAQEINSLAEEERRKIAQVERSDVQFYGWGIGQIAPNSKKQIDALLRSGIQPRLFTGADKSLVDYLKQKTDKRSISIMNENIEIRALQSYLCKGIANMDEDERRALTTTGGGAAVIPTEIADKIITDAGHSILTHRAHRFADGRRGRLVVPMMLPTGEGVGWHDELETIEAFDQSIGGVSIEGMELVKIVCASTSMNVMAVDAFESYIMNLLSGELLDTLERAYITGKKGEIGPADGLDNLNLTDRTITATNAITIENIAEAVAKLPSKVQYGSIVMGNATTLASLLTTQGSYAFDMRTTLKDMGIELVQNPYVSDGTVYAVGQPSESLFLNFWQPISVEASKDALFMKAGIAIRALAVCGFVWVPEFVAKVTTTA